MPTSPSSRQQFIPVLILAPHGFINGTLHLPTMKGLHAFLNASEEILKLTEVVLPGGSEAYPFLALQKSATHLLAPREALDSEVNYMNTTRRLVTCLLSMGSIRGYIEVLENVRVSDFLLRNNGFIEFKHCYLAPDPQVNLKEVSGEPLAQVFVNARSMVGVMELAPEID
ncbi:MAG TPA: hypothetical protein PKM35_02770 [Holophaga sp.]|nr:hypothetical protein [Holophaga sp.]